MTLTYSSSLKLTLPETAANNPVDLELICTQQNMGIEFATEDTEFPDQYFNELLDGHVIMCHSLS